MLLRSLAEMLLGQRSGLPSLQNKHVLLPSLDDLLTPRISSSLQTLVQSTWTPVKGTCPETESRTEPETSLIHCLNRWGESRARQLRPCSRLPRVWGQGRDQNQPLIAQPRAMNSSGSTR